MAYHFQTIVLTRHAFSHHTSHSTHRPAARVHGVALLFCVLLICCTTYVVTANTAAWHTGDYGNLFVQILGKSYDEVDAKVYDQMYNFFENTGATTCVRRYRDFGTDQAYILAENDVRSEGQSYGMMLAVQTDRKIAFDKLWKYAKTRMQHKSGAFAGYFAWRMNLSGSVWGATPAPDGEMYFVMALYFAAKRWGNGSGIFNYEAEANYIVRQCLHQRDDGNGVNIFHPTANLPVFAPGTNYTDPSYTIAAFYKLWSMWASQDQSKLTQITAAARTLYRVASHPTTGLFPNLCNFNGTSMGSKYYFGGDAIRCPFIMMLDFVWFREEDDRHRQHADKLLAFFNQDKIFNGNSCNFQLNGTNMNSGWWSPGMWASVATLVHAASDPAAATRIVEKVWNIDNETMQGCYYDNSVYLLSLLLASGKFIVWGAPAAPIARRTSPVAAVHTAGKDSRAHIQARSRFISVTAIKNMVEFDALRGAVGHVVRVDGRSVRRLYEANGHLAWDYTDERGRKVAPGMYRLSVE